MDDLGNKEVFAKNLKHYMDLNKKSRNDIAKITNVPYSTVSSWCNALFYPRIDKIEMLANYFNVLKSDLVEDKEKNISYQFYMCPVYGRISAGQPNWAEENIEGRIPVPTTGEIDNPEECFYLKVNGESMNKVVKNGAYALIHKQDIVEDGEIAVVLVNGFDATLKKFSKQGDFVILEPMSNVTDDPDIKTQIYDKSTSIKILGKYIGKFEMNG